MYENEIAATAAILSTRSGSTGPRGNKIDRTFTARMTELLAKLEEMGFSDWVVCSTPPQPVHWAEPRVSLDGKERSTGEPVRLRLWNSHGMLVPKHLTFSLIRISNNRGVVVGVHVGTFRMTDLRTRTSWYDGSVWGEAHFRGQLAVEAFRNKLVVSPETVMNCLAAAGAKLAELGVTDTRHVLLPSSDQNLKSAIMVPYLVGMYGTVPAAIRMSYEWDPDLEMNAIKLTFFIIDAVGTINIDFGHIRISEKGKVTESIMDIGKLLAGPQRN